MRSFKANGEHLKKFLVSLNFSPRFAILRDRWITQYKLDLCNLEAYRAFHTYQSIMRSGGISVFTKDDLVAKTYRLYEHIQ